MSSSATITDQLLRSPEIGDLYQRATQCPFLILAGEGRLRRDQLSGWLSQDRLYAQAYARFIGGLISRVELPVELKNPKGNRWTPQWRILSLLQRALGGIMMELQEFELAAAEYGLDLASREFGREGDEFAPNQTTQEYLDLFDSFTAQKQGDADRTLLDGLVVLWATEKIYLDSWTYASQQTPRNADPSQDLDGGAMRKDFIPNWTSDKFKEFVEDIKECLDAYAANQTDDNDDVVQAGCSAIFKKVLKLEEGFWPVVA
ncbi:heme oxygenase-like protein [Xylariomycetidae sp. FL0641]|nr:heme oxygenase-like protein [Xylariomycetidae sp. FL0641]